MTEQQGFLFDIDLPTCSMFGGFDVTLQRKDDRAKAAQLAMLTAMLHEPTRTFTTAEIVRNLDEPFDDGGKWLGPAIRQLFIDGITIPATPTVSRRKTRHCGLTNAWRLNDIVAAKSRIERLTSTLELHPPKESDSMTSTVTESPSTDNSHTGDKANG